MQVCVRVTFPCFFALVELASPFPPGHVRPSEPGDRGCRVPLWPVLSWPPLAWRPGEVEVGCWAVVMTCDHQGAGLHLPSLGGPVVQPQLCSWKNRKLGRPQAFPPAPPSHQNQALPLPQTHSGPARPPAIWGGLIQAKGWDFDIFLRMERKTFLEPYGDSLELPTELSQGTYKNGNQMSTESRSWVWNGSNPTGLDSPRVV